MSARANILARLRRVRRDGAPLPQGPRPRVAEDLTTAFLAALEAAAASHERLGAPGDLVERVIAYREQAGLAGPTAIAPALADYDWPQALEPEIGTTDGRAMLAVSRAWAGVAETGSLLLCSDLDTPTRLNFLPDHEVLVLARSRIVRHLEDAWEQIGTDMPRAVNLVTGPSRTADVEQTLQLGAHGPRRLHLMLMPD